VHSPGRMTDGGARSTSNFVNCAAYLLSTDRLQPLPLKKGDHILVNFGLHDYNLGLSGVPEYKTEYAAGLAQVMKVAAQAGARVTILGTTPAHNTAKAADDVTVVALNKAAAALASRTRRVAPLRAAAAGFRRHLPVTASSRWPARRASSSARQPSSSPV